MEKLRTAFLISGSGTTMEAAVLACQAGRLTWIEPAVVIASRPEADGIRRAYALDIPVSVLRRKDYETKDAYGDALIAMLEEHHVDLVSQNGWLPMIPANAIEAFHNRIIGQHPGPLDPGRPDFGGKGMYGKRVTCARIAYLWVTGEDQWTESTIHTVTSEYDKGDILSARRFRFNTVGDGVDFVTLREQPAVLRTAVDEVCQKFLEFEHENVIFTLHFLSNGVVPRVFGREPLIPENQYDTLRQAKNLAIELYPAG